MAIYSQLEDLPSQAPVASCPHCLQEIDSPLTWVFCFLAYMAVCTNGIETRMLTYARLVTRKAQCHGGAAWQEYNKWLQQQQSAMMVQHSWNANLCAASVCSISHVPATTVISLWLGRSRFCREPDHSEFYCALALLQSPQPPSLSVPALPHLGKQVLRLETLECICSSWNKGCSVFPSSCRFRHVCATCRCKAIEQRTVRRLQPICYIREYIPQS